MSGNIARFFHFSLEIEFNALRFINYTIPRLCSTYAVATIVYREIQLIALMLMTSSKARAPEMRMITIETHIEMIKHHSEREQTLNY